MDKETEVKLKKWLKQNYFCAQYFINKNKGISAFGSVLRDTV